MANCLGGPVTAVIVNHKDLVINLFALKHGDHRRDCSRNRRDLVMRRYDDDNFTVVKSSTNGGDPSRGISPRMVGSLRRVGASASTKPSSEEDLQHESRASGLLRLVVPVVVFIELAILYVLLKTGTVGHSTTTFRWSWHGRTGSAGTG